MTKEQQFIPSVGMEPATKEGNGYKGKIEYVGIDYFILRSYRTNEPLLIRPFEYHNFTDYTYIEASNISDELLKNINIITDQYRKDHNIKPQ